MRKLGAFLSAFLIAVPVLADAPIGDGAADLPLFDAHMHYKIEAWDDYPPSTVVELMDKTGVAQALVSSTPDRGTIKLWKFAPDRFVPEMRPYAGQANSRNWTTQPGMLDYIVKRLDSYPHTGIGEFHLHRIDVRDKDLINGIVSLAVERDLFIHIHSGAEPVRFLFKLEPRLKIIWAHAGMSDPPHIIRDLMDRHENLYADTSYREHDILSPDGIDAKWKALLIDHADRFMVGSDTWVNDQWAMYQELMGMNRKWLRYLPKAVAEQIAFKNAERLYQRKIQLD
ncbi:amidohydrolase family protein [Magnetovibrio sp. PR-2]|uniref:amidohydrolase family protein n=1 Tax=Magnetovibrio sp. PR-2 TaxID=3120356 RepID=UPI002FCE3662